jgi:transposase-like protein
MPRPHEFSSRLQPFLDEAEADVLAYMTFQAQHRAKLHSTNPIERLNVRSSAAPTHRNNRVLILAKRTEKHILLEISGQDHAPFGALTGR